MSSSLINNGIQFLNPPVDKNQKTIIVIGSPRSGTSMIGKVFYSLGVFNGDLDESVYADRKAIDVLENNPNDEKVSQFFSEQNELYDVWGFKRPGAFFYLKKYEKYIRNLVYVVPFKDILSISIRKKISIGQDFLTSLDETKELYVQLVDFIKNNKKPMLLFSYEKAMLDPQRFVHSIIEQLQLDCTEEQISNAINSLERNPKSYLNSSRETVVGNVEPIRKGILSGWAKAKNHDNQVEVSLFVNGKFVQTKKSNMYRADLEKANIGNGKHAYMFEVDCLDLKKGDEIKVVAGIHKDELKNSPLIVSD